MVLSQAELEIWIRQENYRKPTVQVDDPEFHQGSIFAKSYLDFKFTVTPTEGSPYSSRHRFSEVETIRDKLKAKYVKLGVFVPAIPTKGISQDGSNPNNLFAKERMRGLYLFCDQIFANPFLANDELWLNFLGSPSK
jgi:hypothetical protein